MTHVDPPMDRPLGQAHKVVYKDIHIVYWPRFLVLEIQVTGKLGKILLG